MFSQANEHVSELKPLPTSVRVNQRQNAYATGLSTPKKSVLDGVRHEMVHKFNRKTRSQINKLYTRLSNTPDKESD